MMEYKGFQAQVEFDDEANIFHGEVVNAKTVITFQGASVDELHAAFEESVDVYLEWCEKRGKVPEKPFSGKFMVRIPPEMHRQIFLVAKQTRKSLNSWITDTLDGALSSQQGKSL